MTACTASGASWCSGTRVPPTIGERGDLRVGGERRVAEAAEQAHHRQVELAVAAEARRIDQPRPTGAIDEAVPGPQVAVQARGRLGLAGEVGDAAGDRVEAADRRDGGVVPEVVGVAQEPRQRGEPLRCVELGPRRARLVRQPAAPGRALVLAAERRRAG